MSASACTRSTPGIKKLTERNKTIVDIMISPRCCRLVNARPIIHAPNGPLWANMTSSKNRKYITSSLSSDEYYRSVATGT